MLKIREIHWSYGEKQVLNSLSLELQKGHILGLLGENGSGKTTLLRCMAGILEPQKGSVHWEQFHSIEEGYAYRAQVSYLPEGAPHYSGRRVGEYLQMRKAIQGSTQESLDRLMERTGLLEVRDEQIDRLSKGFRQRVALSACLLSQAPLILLDEPFSGLDPAQVLDLRDLLRETAQQGKTIVFSSHILPEIYQLCDPIVLIRHGRISGTYRKEELETMEELEGLFRGGDHD